MLISYTYFNTTFYDFNWRRRIFQLQIIKANCNSKNNTFFNCQSLVDISLPSSIKEIGVDAFLGCTSLKTASSLSIENKSISYLNTDEYQIDSSKFGIKGTNEKTGELVEFFVYNQNSFDKLKKFKQGIDFSRIGIPTLIKIQNFRFPKEENIRAKRREQKPIFGFTDYIVMNILKMEIFQRLQKTIYQINIIKKI